MILISIVNFSVCLLRVSRCELKPLNTYLVTRNIYSFTDRPSGVIAQVLPVISFVQMLLILSKSKCN